MCCEYWLALSQIGSLPLIFLRLKLGFINHYLLFLLDFFSSQGGLGPKGSVGRTPMIFTIQSNSISVLSHDVKPRCGHIHPMSHVRTKTRTWDKHVCHVPATINKFCSTQHNSASIPRKLNIFHGEKSPEVLSKNLSILWYKNLIEWESFLL